MIKAWSSTCFGHPEVIDPAHVDLREIEVRTDAWGRPAIRLHGAIADSMADYDRPRLALPRPRRRRRGRVRRAPGEARSPEGCCPQMGSVGLPPCACLVTSNTCSITVLSHLATSPTPGCAVRGVQLRQGSRRLASPPPAERPTRGADHHPHRAHLRVGRSGSTPAPPAPARRCGRRRALLLRLPRTRRGAPGSSGLTVGRAGDRVMGRARLSRLGLERVPSPWSCHPEPCPRAVRELKPGRRSPRTPCWPR